MFMAPEKIKGRLKKIANDNKADARVLLRIFMMERFMERIAVSQYADNFVIKGGILVTSMVGVSMRSTMDIDTSVQNMNLSKDDALKVVTDIANVEIDDGVTFEIKSVDSIMDDMEYPGIRITLNALLDRVVVPIKIDISTGDVITPRAIEYQYPLMLENRSIRLWSYNVETIVAEKMETILSRGILNTRMRDFYDIYTLFIRYFEQLDKQVLRSAFEATCNKRGSVEVLREGDQILINIANDEVLAKMWEAYQKKYSYATGISFDYVVNRAKELYKIVILVE